MKPLVLVHQTREALAQVLAQDVRIKALAAVEERGRCDIALSGGSTPELLYRLMGQDQFFPWARTRFFLVDERFVPSDHPDWNSGMIRRAFGREDLQYYPVDTDEPSDADMGAKWYESLLREAFGQEAAASGSCPVFDVVLLGMGKDGHTASLFPGTGAVNRRDQLVFSVSPLTAAHNRITLSLPVLLAARQVILLATGADKADMLARVLSGPDPELPASMLATGPGPVEFRVDQAAAPGA